MLDFYLIIVIFINEKQGIKIVLVTVFVTLNIHAVNEIDSQLTNKTTSLTSLSFFIYNSTITKKEDLISNQYKGHKCQAYTLSNYI